ncbi:hypothetical protein GCM10009602_53490 [Nocardiopsis tropica]
MRARGRAGRQESVPVSTTVPPKVGRSTIAAHDRGSTKVSVTAPKDSFETGPRDTGTDPEGQPVDEPAENLP